METNRFHQIVAQLTRGRDRQSRVDLLLVFVAVAMLVWVAVTALDIGHWRHDEVAYLDKGGMIYRTRSEGRWLNMLLYYPTRWFSPEVGWVLDTAFLGGGLGLLFSRLGLGAGHAIVASIIILLFPGYIAQSLWPTSNLPALVIFVGTAFCLWRDRLPWLGWPRLVVLPFAGIALFATIPHFYFLLLPMLVPRATVRSVADFGKGLVPGIIWSTGLVLGYLAAIVVNGLRYGHYSLELEGWRKAAAPDITGSVPEQVLQYIAMMAGDVMQWLPVVCILGWLAVIVVSVWRWMRHGGNVPTLLLRLGYVAVLVSLPYLVGAAGGIVVQFRSIIPVALGLLVLPLLFPVGQSWKVYVALGVVLLGIPSAWKSYDELAWFRTLAKDNVAAVAAALPEGLETRGRAMIWPDGYEAYFNSRRAALGIDRIKPDLMEGLGHEDFRIGPAFVENGFAEFGACSSDQIDCTALRRGETRLPYCETAKAGSICAQSILNDGSVLFRFKMTDAPFQDLPAE